MLAELSPTGAVLPWKRVSTDIDGWIGAIGMMPDGVVGLEAIRLPGIDGSLGIPNAWEAAGSALREVSSSERRVGYFPWKDGSVLVLRSNTVQWSVTKPIPLMTHKTHFEVLAPNGKVAPAAPKLPDHVVHADRFMAYPDGRVFLFAEPRKTYADGGAVPDIDNAAIYPLDGSAPIPTPGFDARDVLIPGDDMLLAKVSVRSGAPMLAKIDLAARKTVNIAVEASGELMPLLEISRGDDGEIWLITGTFTPDKTTYGGLYRGRIDGSHLAVTRVALPPAPDSNGKEFDPVSVVAHGANDVWVIARDDVPNPDRPRYLLHLQPKPPATVTKLDDEEIVDEAWAEKPPEPYDDVRCRNALLVLGDGDAITEAQITAAAAKHKQGNPSEARRGVLGGNDVWALQFEPGRGNAPLDEAKVWKRDFPKAKLYCARILTKQKLPIASEE